MKKSKLSHPVTKAQGDLLFVRVDGKAPRGTVRNAVHGRHILAEGEVTGHHHSVSAQGATVIDEGGLTYLTVEELTEVQHQEHGAVALEPGTWLVKRQREMSVVDLLPRQVAD